jgi:hypothetical protein
MRMPRAAAALVILASVAARSLAAPAGAVAAMVPGALQLSDAGPDEVAVNDSLPT